MVLETEILIFFFFFFFKHHHHPIVLVGPGLPWGHNLKEQLIMTHTS